MKEDPHVVGISEVELTATRSSGRPILTNETVGSFKLVTQPCYYNNKRHGKHGFALVDEHRQLDVSPSGPFGGHPDCMYKQHVVPGDWDNACTFRFAANKLCVIPDFDPFVGFEQSNQSGQLVDGAPCSLIRMADAWFKKAPERMAGVSGDYWRLNPDMTLSPAGSELVLGFGLLTWDPVNRKPREGPKETYTKLCQATSPDRLIVATGEDPPEEWQRFEAWMRAKKIKLLIGKIVCGVVLAALAAGAVAGYLWWNQCSECVAWERQQNG